MRLNESVSLKLMLIITLCCYDYLEFHMQASQSENIKRVLVVAAVI
jgi:hypothetical protein